MKKNSSLFMLGFIVIISGWWFLRRDSFAQPEKVNLPQASASAVEVITEEITSESVNPVSPDTKEIPTRVSDVIPIETQTVDEIENTVPFTVDLGIREALADHLGANANDLVIVINEKTDSHARGGVENGYFLAAKVVGQWRIVADGQGVLDCVAIAQYGFPASMVPECRNTDEGERIQLNFKPGGTFTYVQKSIKTGEQHTYILNASAGQTMIISASSPHDDVYTHIKGVQDGKQLLPDSALASSWTGLLPQTQGYQITLWTNNPDTTYFLTVEIPVNIRFEKGAYSAIVDGHIAVFDTSPSISIDNHVTYLIYASAGQTMDAQLFSPNPDALSMGIYGQTDGQPYLRYQVKNSGYHGILPLSQGYYLEVFTNGPSTDFSLHITIH